MKNKMLIALAAVVLTSLSGCIKDKDFEAGKFGLKDAAASPVGVGIPQASNEVNVNSIVWTNTNQALTVPLVNLLSDEPAPEDLHITLELNPQLVTNYNDNNNPDLEPLPQGSYTIPTMTVVIPKGQRTGTLTLNIPDATVFDASKRYGIGYTIKSVQEQGYTIAENLRNVLFAIAIRNQYEGTYAINVDLTGHPSASGHYEEDGTFTTIDANSVDAPLGVALIFSSSSRINIRVNPDNSLSISSTATTINPLPPGANYYDPATRTFHFDYSWGAGPRHLVGTARRL